MALDSLDGYLQTELTAMAATITAWQAALAAPDTYDWKATSAQLSAMVARAQTFVDFYRAGKNSQGG